MTTEHDQPPEREPKSIEDPVSDLRIRPAAEAEGSDATPSSRQAWSARPALRISTRAMWTFGVAGIAVLALGVWLVVALLPRLLNAPVGTQTDQAPTGGASEGRRIQATLFYVSDDGGGLVASNRAVLYGPTSVEQARRIVEAVVEAPPDGRRSAIPTGTTVRSVFLAGSGQAYVDLGGAIVSGHTGGSLDEALAVYAVVNALTVNLPGITTVQILVEGQQVDTLAGHIDLRYPLAKSLDWVRKGSERAWLDWMDGCLTQCGRRK